MNLSVHERMVLLDILPREGTFVKLRLLKELRTFLGFSEVDIERFKPKETQLEDGRGRVEWDMSVDQMTEISISPTQREMIVEALQKMNAEARLTDREYSLYEKFVEGLE